jgi:hypothetical protein
MRIYIQHGVSFGRGRTERALLAGKWLFDGSPRDVLSDPPLISARSGIRKHTASPPHPHSIRAEQMLIRLALFQDDLHHKWIQSRPFGTGDRHCELHCDGFFLKGNE